MLFSAAAEKLKVKSYQTILNIKDSQKVFADVKDLARLSARGAEAYNS